MNSLYVLIKPTLFKNLKLTNSLYSSKEANTGITIDA